MTSKNSKKTDKTRTRVIEAYFKDFRRRVNTVVQLKDEGSITEATLLVCCYIEALGRRANPEERGSKRSFVKVLERFGSEAMLSVVHPVHLSDALEESRSRKERELGAKLRETLPSDKALGEASVIAHASAYLSKKQMSLVRKRCWIGRLSAIAYTYIRCSLVHRGAALNIEFDSATYEGRQLPRLDLGLLLRELDSVVDKVEDHCLKHPALFG